MEIEDSLMIELRELPPDKLAEVVRFVQNLNPKSLERRRAIWMSTAASMPGEQGEDFESSVRADADRIEVEP